MLVGDGQVIGFEHANQFSFESEKNERVGPQPLVVMKNIALARTKQVMRWKLAP